MVASASIHSHHAPSQKSERHPSLTPSHPDPHLFPSHERSYTLRQPTFYLPPLLSSLPASSTTPALPNETETRLPQGTVDPASLALHKALHAFRPVGKDYAEREYGEAFNWGEMRLEEGLEREWYCVIFRSKRTPHSQHLDHLLYSADALAHAEAIKHGGLLMYWYGVPDEVTGLNLATCIWQSRHHALAAISGPEHIKAMRLAATSYEVYELERWVLGKVAGEEGVTVRPWRKGEEVGW